MEKKTLRTTMSSVDIGLNYVFNKTNIIMIRVNNLINSSWLLYIFRK